MAARSLLRNVADGFGATFQTDDGAAAIYTVRPPLPSGAPSPAYCIRITDHSGWVVAREQAPCMLPTFCPERHINDGGEFCLFWHEAEPLRIVDEGSAEKWWGKVVLFLQLQAAAAKYRRWPGKVDARAHGAKAACFQDRAESAAVLLGPQFEKALRQRRLTTVRRRHRGEERVRLLLDDKRIASVLEGPRRTMSLRSRCPCDVLGKRPLKACGDHAADIVDLTLSLDGWRRAEVEFFHAVKSAGRICCGTIDGCPLAAEAHPVRQEAA